MEACRKTHNTESKRLQCPDRDKISCTSTSSHRISIAYNQHRSAARSVSEHVLYLTSSGWEDQVGYTVINDHAYAADCIKMELGKEGREMG